MLASLATGLIVIGTAGLYYILGLREGRRQVERERQQELDRAISRRDPDDIDTWDPRKREARG